MARKRLTRREIVQEDPFQAALTGLFEWATRNRNLLLAALAMVILGVLGSYFWQDYQANRQKEFQIRFADALEVYHAPLAKDISENAGGADGASEYHFQSDAERLDVALEKFSALAADSGQSSIGLLSSYYSALIKKELGRSEEAKEILKSIVNRAGPETASLARNLLAEIAEAENDPAGARALLERILEEDLSSFPKEYVLLQLGENHQAAGNREEALGFYRRITTEYPDSVYSEAARSKIEQLEAESVPQN